jgi:hypothetical protein
MKEVFSNRFQAHLFSVQVQKYTFKVQVNVLVLQKCTCTAKMYLVLKIFK